MLSEFKRIFNLGLQNTPMSKAHPTCNPPIRGEDEMMCVFTINVGVSKKKELVSARSKATKQSHEIEVNVTDCFSRLRRDRNDSHFWDGL